MALFERTEHAPGAVRRARGLRVRMNVPERKLWAELRKLGVNIRRQAPIGRYIVDFVSHGAKLVIEVDGGVHERLDEVVLRDAERSAWLRAEGYRVVRFTDREVMADVHSVVGRVKQELALPLDGGGLGGGVSSEARVRRSKASAPARGLSGDLVHTPPSPALPPSRGKGEAA